VGSSLFAASRWGWLDRIVKSLHNLRLHNLEMTVRTLLQGDFMYRGAPSAALPSIEAMKVAHSVRPHEQFCPLYYVSVIAALRFSYSLAMIALCARTRCRRGI
jgi:hypothetical protein